MTIETSYSEARQHLATLLDRAVQDRETIIITRHNGDRVALLPADDLASYEETTYLLRSPPARGIARVTGGRGGAVRLRRAPCSP
jgi:antitoxin YefM